MNKTGLKLYFEYYLSTDNYMKTLNVLSISSIISISLLAGCTKPGETTGIGAATGGALGAGLGAIVGNQTGNPGSGLVIGAAAGASAGALVANALESQQKTVQQQDEALERQEATLQAQKYEIEELRRGGTDYRARPSFQKSPSSLAPGDLYGSTPSTGTGRETFSETTTSERSAPQRRSIEKVAHGDLYLSAGTSSASPSPVTVQHKNIESLSNSSSLDQTQNETLKSDYIEAPVPSVPGKTTNPGKASLNTEKAGKSLKKAINDDAAETVVGSELTDSETSILETDIPNTTASIPSEAAPGAAAEKINLSDAKPLSDAVDAQTEEVTKVSAVNIASAKECKGATAEVSKAKSAKDSGDKLFHYRRALRICPQDASIHKELGALYASLGRKEDASFEYQEALKVNPQDEEAKSKISELK